MDETDPEELKPAIERTCGGMATLVQSVPTRETFNRATVWEGVVRVSDVEGQSNRRATRVKAEHTGKMKASKKGKSVYAEVGFWLEKDDSNHVTIEGVKGAHVAVQH